MAERYLRVTMNDGSQWDVPLFVIVNALREFNSAMADEESSPADDDDLIDWAENNMNWDDVSSYAEKVNEPNPTEYQYGWVNGEKAIVTK